MNWDLWLTQPSDLKSEAERKHLSKYLSMHVQNPLIYVFIHANKGKWDGFLCCWLDYYIILLYNNYIINSYMIKYPKEFIA